VSTSTRRNSHVVAILAGLVLLGLVAAFAIGLPKATGDEGSGAASTPDHITMPDSIPGGYQAADVAASFAGGQLAGQAKQIAAQQQASTDYANKVLPQVLGAPAASRSYVLDGTKAVFVQAFAAAGGAFAPSSLSDPATTNGGGGRTMKAVGDGVCILTYGQAQAGAPAPANPGDSQCQVSRDGLTVQIEAGDMDPAELVKAADALLTDLAG
jgi:hypothetical protein